MSIKRHLGKKGNMLTIKDRSNEPAEEDEADVDIDFRPPLLEGISEIFIS